MKVVINSCFGGFGLSKKAYEFLGLKWDTFGFKYEEDRTNSKLIKCVETLGDKANGRFAKLSIVEVPDDVKWHIDEYDGSEHIAENHKTWG